MNIGIFISRLSKTGPVNVIYNLIHETADISIKYIIFTLRPELVNNTRIKDFSELNIMVKCLYDRNIINIYKNIREELGSCNIDIIHAHCFRSLVFCSFFKIKKIFTVHQNFYYDWQLNYGFIGKLMVLVENKMLPYWNIIICCAKYLEPIIKNRIKNDNIYHIINGVLPLVVSNKKTSKHKTVTYIYVGSIDKRKNVKLLCEQFSHNALGNEKLICVGTGSDFPAIQKMNYPNIKLLGFKDNISEFLCQSDYFISMSFSEGLPLAVIEALSCGLPVILSDIPAHRDFFTLNNKIGVLIADNFNEALKRIRSNNYEEMSTQVYNTYFQYLTAKKMAEEYIEHYKSLKNKTSC
ncbi:glycosyl transferase [Spirochaetia bacterium]|nr:glycosyl transferase [Spirochaetia bacterium]